MKEFTVDPNGMEATVKFIQSFAAGKCDPKKRKSGVWFLAGGRKVTAKVIAYQNGFYKLDFLQRYYLRKEEIEPVVKAFFAEGKPFYMRTGLSNHPVQVRFALENGEIPEKKKEPVLVRIMSDIIYGKTVEEVKKGTFCPCCGGDKTLGSYSCAECLAKLRKNFGMVAVSSAFGELEKVLKEIKEAEVLSLIENPEKETALPPVLVNIKINKKALWKEDGQYYRSILAIKGGYVAVYIKGLPKDMQGKTVTCLVTGKYNSNTPYLRAQFVSGIRASVKFFVQDGEKTNGMKYGLPALVVNETVKVIDDNEEKKSRGINCTIGFKEV